MPIEARILGRTGLEACVIGLGTEHLPANRENMDAVKESEMDQREIFI